MPPARAPRRQPASFPGYQATTGTRAEQAARDALPGHPLARHIDDFLADLANANKPRNTIRAYRGDLIAFAAHHDGDIAELTAAPVRAFLGEIAGQAPSTRKRKRAAVASFCRWAVRHELLDASPMDRIDAIEVPRTLPRPGGRRRHRGGAGCDLLPAAAQGRAGRRAAGPGAVRDRLRLRRPRLGGLRDVRRGPGPAPGRRARPRPRQGRHRPHRAARRPRLRRAAPALPRPVRVHVRPAVPRVASTAAAARCPTTRRTTGGRSTAPPPASGSASTSSATPTPPS